VGQQPIGTYVADPYPAHPLFVGVCPARVSVRVAGRNLFSDTDQTVGSHRLFPAALAQAGLSDQRSSHGRTRPCHHGGRIPKSCQRSIPLLFRRKPGPIVTRHEPFGVSKVFSLLETLVRQPDGSRPAPGQRESSYRNRQFTPRRQLLLAANWITAAKREGPRAVGRRGGCPLFMPGADSGCPLSRA
jgi:hypothetical protein